LIEKSFPVVFSINLSARRNPESSPMVSLAHIIHPVIVDPSSDLTMAQPITFESMRIARDFSVGRVDVSLYAIQHHDEERLALPGCFVRTPDLTRSVGDIRTSAARHKLVLLKDILDALYAAGPADYLIYTDVDIVLLPYFYWTVSQLIAQGHDAFAINHRTIPDGDTSPRQGPFAADDLDAGHMRLHRRAARALRQMLGDILAKMPARKADRPPRPNQESPNSVIPWMYSAIGVPHSGYDCFVFRRELYPHFKLGTIGAGTDWAGRAMLANLVTYADRFREFANAHLTFRIGDRQPPRSNERAHDAQANWNEYMAIFQRLEAERGEFDLPLRSYLLDSGAERKVPDFDAGRIPNLAEHTLPIRR
jgi:hypothetical protein